MTITEVRRTLDTESTGRQLYALVSALYPICRSITGEGVRETLRRLRPHIDLTLHEVPSGTRVFDWIVPPEWNIRDAYVKNAAGERVIDFRESNLAVMGYSVPVRRRLSLAELKEHLFTLPEHPDWIPHRTSYYQEAWGFCLSHRRLLALEEGEYEVCIDSSLAPGHLTYGEYYVAGACPDEVLVSCHVCHPSLCNDNLSGIAVAAFLAACLTRASLRYSYRFLFIPATIGALTWLSRSQPQVARLRHGLVLACIGDAGGYTYKRSRRGNAEIDRTVALVLRDRGVPYRVEDFSPTGYDERQFCSPGFNLPVGCLMRTPHGGYPEYHTSADNLDVVRPEALADSLETCLAVADVLEGNRRYLNQNPKGEPNLGRWGLYHPIGGRWDRDAGELARLWALNLSDGEHGLLEIAERSGLAFDTVQAAVHALLAVGLLQEAWRGSA